MSYRRHRLPPGVFGSTSIPVGESRCLARCGMVAPPLDRSVGARPNCAPQPTLTRAVMNARTELLKMGLLAGLSTLAISCGGGSSKPLTEDDFCVQKSTKECEIADTCSVTATDCQTARKKVCKDWVAAIKTADPQRVFRPENVAACVNKTADVYRQSTIKPSDVATLDDL